MKFPSKPTTKWGKYEKKIQSISEFIQILSVLITPYIHWTHINQLIQKIVKQL